MTRGGNRGTLSFIQQFDATKYPLLYVIFGMLIVDNVSIRMKTVATIWPHR